MASSVLPENECRFVINVSIRDEAKYRAHVPQIKRNISAGRVDSIGKTQPRVTMMVWRKMLCRLKCAIKWDDMTKHSDIKMHTFLSL